MKMGVLELTLVMCEGATHTGVKITKETPTTGRKHENDTY